MQAAKLLEEHAAAEEGEYGHHLTDRWVDHMHQGVYLDAAHSMSAVAMLAPFIESLFSAVFREIRRREEKERPPAAMDKRTRLSRDLLWNPHLVLNAREVNDDLVKGIEELAEATDLATHLPKDYLKTLKALFTYRNKMVHLGFEWPVEERAKFANAVVQQKWPTAWFSQATSGGEPWIYYMSSVFIEHCLKTIDGILIGIGAYLRDQEAADGK